MPHKFSDRMKAMRQQLDSTMMRLMDLKQILGIHLNKRRTFPAGRLPMTDANHDPLGDSMIKWIKQLLTKYTNVA